MLDTVHCAVLEVPANKVIINVRVLKLKLTDLKIEVERERD